MRLSLVAKAIILLLLIKHVTSDLITLNLSVITGLASIILPISFLTIDDNSLSGATEYNYEFLGYNKSNNIKIRATKKLFPDFLAISNVDFSYFLFSGLLLYFQHKAFITKYH